MKTNTKSFIITFLLMFCLWFILSGKTEPLLLILGIISALIVGFWSRNLVFQEFKFSRELKIFCRFLKYIPWLLYQIALANFHVLYLVFHPRMKELIDPQVITFDTSLKKDMAIVTLANSITLTPGTITISANIEGRFKVHALDKTLADSLPGEMEKKVFKIFE